ncbi:MAG: putative cadmium-transporting ATPase [Chlamydiae bacterium]|nr:putative cadmium-transporting ATPase [Chlamydiota bacterium]
MSKIISQKISEKNENLLTDFLESGHSHTVSPFLTLDSRKWAKHLSLKISIFSLALLVLAIGFSFIERLSPISAFFQVIIFFLAGTPALIEALEKVKKMKVSIDVLMVLAAFLSIFIHSSLEGALLLVLFSISHSLEHFVSHKARSTLNRLNKMVPSVAQVISSTGKIIERSVKDVRVNELIWVRAGEILPLDGRVVEGTSSLNVAHLTGEHAPIPISEGEEAPSGAVNVEGTLKLSVIRTGAQSTISRIIQLICDANKAKPKLQSWFDRFGQKYSLFVILSSFFFAIALPLLIPSLGYFGPSGSIYRALAYLIAASPCALIIAVPIAYVSAINSSAKLGIILKGGITLDALAKVKSIAFDKTGTLTSGELECLSVQHLDGSKINDATKVLSIARGLEQHALHPVAQALIHYADYRGISPCQVSDCRAIPGHGIQGTAEYEGLKYEVAVGSINYVASLSSERAKLALNAYKNELGHLIAALKIDDEIYLFQFVDHLRPDAQNVLKQLKEELGLKTYILSGDNDLSVKRIASNLNVNQYFGQLKPADKLKLVEQYSQEENLAMVGDGINDTPALARASVGISLGNVGSHMGSEISDVVLIKNDLSLIYKLFLKAKKTLSIVKQNVFLAAIIIVFISIPALFGWIPLWLAVVFHEGGTVLVGLNSLRLLKNK